MESNHPTGGLLRPAGFEDRMGHQTPAAPPAILDRRSGRDSVRYSYFRGQRSVSRRLAWLRLPAASLLIAVARALSVRFACAMRLSVDGSLTLTVLVWPPASVKLLLPSTTITRTPPTRTRPAVARPSVPL